MEIHEPPRADVKSHAGGRARGRAADRTSQLLAVARSLLASRAGADSVTAPPSN